MHSLFKVGGESSSSSFFFKVSVFNDFALALNVVVTQSVLTTTSAVFVLIDGRKEVLS